MAAVAAVLPVEVVAQRSLLAHPLQVLVLLALALLAKDVVARAQLLLLVHPLQVQVLLALALPALALPAKDAVVLAQLLLLVPRPLLAQAPREAAVAEEAVEMLTRSFSAAMAGILPSPGPPMYAPAQRSRRKPKRRPCPLT